MAGTMFLLKPFSFLLPPHYDNLSKIGRVTVPKLFVHGEADTIVPFNMGRKLFHASEDPKFFLSLKEADHNDTYIVGGKKYLATLSSFAKHSKI
jgi:fermentation-respiration switch protein FrsA (DUF1100 family)